MHILKDLERLSSLIASYGAGTECAVYIGLAVQQPLSCALSILWTRECLECCLKILEVERDHLNRPYIRHLIRQRKGAAKQRWRRRRRKEVILLNLYRQLEIRLRQALDAIPAL